VASGKPHKSVPWSDVAKNQSAFLSADVVPEDYVMQDPSRLKVQSAQELIRFWKSSQFSFKGVLEGEEVVEAEEQVPCSKAGRRKTTTARKTSKKKGGKRVQIAKAGKAGKGKGKGKGKATLVTSDEDSEEDALSDTDTEDVSFGEQGDSSGGETRSDTSSDAPESSQEEDFTRAVKKIADDGPGPSNKKSQKPPAKGSPASVAEGNRKAFLQSLCARTEYQELIQAIYSDEVIIFKTIHSPALTCSPTGGHHQSCYARRAAVLQRMVLRSAELAYRRA
jgi:hypothetical protein